MRSRLSSTCSEWFLDRRAFLELGNFAATVVVAALLCGIGAVTGLWPDLDAVDLEAFAGNGFFGGFRCGSPCWRRCWLNRARLCGCRVSWLHFKHH